jgi:hypothetical protein
MYLLGYMQPQLNMTDGKVNIYRIHANWSYGFNISEALPPINSCTRLYEIRY